MFMKSAATIILIIIPFLLKAQDFNQQQRKVALQAEEFYDNLQYNNALLLYQELREAHAGSAYVNSRIAECYRNLLNYPAAEKYYQMVYDTDKSTYPFTVFYLGLMHKLNGQYEEAIGYFDEFEAMAADIGDSERKQLLVMQAEVEEEGCRLAIERQNEPQRNFEFRNLGKPVNTRYNDYGAHPYEHDFSIIFSSGKVEGTQTPLNPRIGEAFHDLYRYEWNLNLNAWQEIHKNDRFSEQVNTQLGDGAGTLTPDNREMYFTSCSQGGDLCYIFYTALKDGKWTKPVSLNDSINLPGYNSRHPSVSVTGDTLFFASDRPGGYGKSDIWMATRKEGYWQNPVNLGDTVNTPFDEVSPFLYWEDNTLFFSSNGHFGYGGYDIFYLDIDHHDLIINAGKPFNSQQTIRV